MKKLITICFLLLAFGFQLSAQSSNYFDDVNLPFSSDPRFTEHGLLHKSLDSADNTKKFPLIVFLHGAGENCTNCDGSQLRDIYTNSQSGGPLYQCYSNNWPDSFLVNGQWFHPWLYAPQASSWSTRPENLNWLLKNLIALYPEIDVNRIYVTGLSAGGGYSMLYGAKLNYNYSANFTPFYPAAAAVLMSEASGEPNAQVEDTLADDNFPVWGFGSLSDSHGIHTRDLINALFSIDPVFYNSDSTNARWTAYSGGHCCWNQFYTPSYHERVNGTVMNIYEWMLQYSLSGAAETNNPPVVNAGSDQNVSGTTTTITLNGSASDDHGIISHQWTQAGGLSVTIINPAAYATDVNGLQSNNIYTFRLTATDDSSTTSHDDVIINTGPVCDASITSVTHTDETSGLQDGTITITATSSAGGLQYSLDNSNFQAGNQFTSLPPATYSVYIKDASGCTDNQTGILIKAYGRPSGDHDTTVNATDWGTNFTIDNEGNHDGMLKPGDTLFIQAGNYQLINLNNISGTADSPIVVMPIGGQVKFSQLDTTNILIGIHELNCNYVKINGQELPGFTYGFYVYGLSQRYNDTLMHGQMQIWGLSSHDEISGVELHRVAYGFICKYDPTCDTASWNQREDKFIDYIDIHDNYIDSTQYEAHYFGYTHNYLRDTKPDSGQVGTYIICNGDTVVTPAARMGHIHIHNQIVLNAGWDAIQANDVAIGWDEIDHNHIVNAGRLQPGGNGQGNGLSLGGSNKIYAHDNYINGVSGYGIFTNALADSIVITRDTILNGQSEALRLQSGYLSQKVSNVYADSSRVWAWDNVIDNPATYGIEFLDYGGTFTYDNRIYNNTITNAPSGAFYHSGSTDRWYGDYGGKPLSDTPHVAPPGNIFNVPPSLLSVKFIQFNYQSVGDSLIFTWQTASENNSDYFALEKSTDGINYSEIGRVKSKSRNGNSSWKLDYEMAKGMKINERMKE